MKLSKIEHSKGRYLFLSKILNLKIGDDVIVKVEVRCNGDIIYLGRNKAKSDNGHGYKSVCITKVICGVKHSKRFYVHRLVATAFLRNPDNLPEVNHKNYKRDDNRVQNLEWISTRDNIIHSFKDHVPLCLVDYWYVLNLHYVFKRGMKAITRETSVKMDMVRDILNGKYNDKPLYSCLGDSRKGRGVIYGRGRLKATGLKYNGGEEMTRDKCAVPICQRDRKTSRWCQTHYTQVYIHGKITREDLGPLIPKKLIPTNMGECVIEGCTKEQKIAKMCPMHYQRKRKEKLSLGVI